MALAAGAARARWEARERRGRGARQDRPVAQQLELAAGRNAREHALALVAELGHAALLQDSLDGLLERVAADAGALHVRWGVLEEAAVGGVANENGSCGDEVCGR